MSEGPEWPLDVTVKSQKHRGHFEWCPQCPARGCGKGNGAFFRGFQLFFKSYAKFSVLRKSCSEAGWNLERQENKMRCGFPLPFRLISIPKRGFVWIFKVWGFICRLLGFPAVNAAGVRKKSDVIHWHKQNRLDIKSEQWILLWPGCSPQGFSPNMWINSSHI